MEQIEESLAQVFSCECCEIFMNTFFHRTPPLAAYENKVNSITEANVYTIHAV